MLFVYVRTHARALVCDMFLFSEPFSLQTLWQNDSLSTASILDRPVCQLVNTLNKYALKCNKIKSVNTSGS